MSHRPSRYGWVTTTSNSFRKQIRWTVKDTGVPIDMTGFVVAASLELDEVGTRVDWQCTIIDGPNGVFQLFLPVETLSDMAPGTWFFDIRITDGGGDVTTYAKQSYLRVDQGITGP